MVESRNLSSYNQALTGALSLPTQRGKHPVLQPHGSEQDRDLFFQLLHCPSFWLVPYSDRLFRTILEISGKECSLLGTTELLPVSICFLWLAVMGQRKLRCFHPLDRESSCCQRPRAQDRLWHRDSMSWQDCPESGPPPASTAGVRADLSFQDCEQRGASRAHASPRWLVQKGKERQSLWKSTPGGWLQESPLSWGRALKGPRGNTPG